MSKIWFTADTHFGHGRTLELSKRPYQNIHEMNWDIVKKWNSVISDEDIVYHLGDFGDFNFSKLLKGRKVLLFGNYEWDEFNLHHSDSTLWDYIDNLKEAYDFYEILTDNDVTIDFNKKVYSLVHEPSYRIPEYFNLFGHIHKLQMVKKNGLNVGVDCHNFYPIDLETVEFYRNAIENHYDDEVFGK